MIDLMYLAIVLAVSVITSASPTLGNAVSLMTSGQVCVAAGNSIGVGHTATTGEVSSLLFNGGIWGLFKYFFGSGIGALDDIASTLTGGSTAKGITAFMLIPGLLGGMLGGSKGFITGLVGAPILLAVVVFLVLLFGFIRLLFVLIDAYINIIISLLTAPFQLMMEAVPGTNAFNGWFRNLLSKIIVFPLTAVLLLVAAILTSQSVSTTIWAPPLLSSGGGTYGMAGIIGPVS